ncbi:MAG: CBS domain-containing protein [Thermodesulfobacteriota bacterium]
MKLTDTIEETVRWDDPGVRSDDTLLTAIRLMAAGNVSGLLVRLNGEVLGIITDWDIMHSVNNGYDPAETRVDKFMTACQAMLGRSIKSPCIQLDGSISIKDALRLMADQNVHHLMVTGGEGEVGLLSSLDLLRAACC